MNDLARAWWALARSVGELSLLAPPVMQRRTARLLGPESASTRNRREALRMVTEKWDAGVAGNAAMWQALWQAQQRYVYDAWAMAWGLRTPRRTAQRMARRTAVDAATLAQRSLAPAVRRVRANHRRLRRAG
jgi:hypothetical protein